MNATVELPESSASVDERERIGKLWSRHLNAGYSRLANLMNLPLEHSAHGAYIVDRNGERYLDAGGYGVFLLGHSHPAVVAAVQAQLERRALASRMLLCPEQAEAAAALVAHCPAPLQYVYFASTGTEATEAALKLACMNGCERVISTQGGYHGKTLGALSVTGREKYREPFRPLLREAGFVPYGEPGAIEQALRDGIGNACVLLEPVQAEAGVIVPPKGYLQEVVSICRRHGALVIFDEIQCGMGRTGRWWASMAEDAVPDIMLIGKSLSGGCVPVSAMVANADVFAPFNKNPLIHTSTFGGNPLAMAAVRATLAAMDAECTVERAQVLGAELETRLSRVIAGSVWQGRAVLRCAGLLIGLEMPEASQAADLVMALLTERVIVCHSLNDHRVVRLTPPASLVEADMEWLERAFASALNAIA